MAKINPVEAEKLLKGLDYPATKQDIIQHAKQHGADENACEALQELPDRTFDSPIGVSKAIGEMERGERGERGERERSKREGREE